MGPDRGVGNLFERLADADGSFPVNDKESLQNPGQLLHGLFAKEIESP